MLAPVRCASLNTQVLTHRSHIQIPPSSPQSTAAMEGLKPGKDTVVLVTGASGPESHTPNPIPQTLN